MRSLVVVILVVGLIGLVRATTSLPDSYSVLGPFPIGEREEYFDTLESYGGIFQIEIGDNASYPSELGRNSVVGWTSVQSETAGALQMQWTDSIDWSFYDMPFGWHLYLWYAWVVGDFTATTSSNYIVNCTGLRTFYIESLSTNEITEFSGDFFNYGNGQQTIFLTAGQEYRAYFRMLSSTRVYGSAFAQFACGLTPVAQDITFVETETLVADVVDGVLASPYGSVTLINTGATDITGGLVISLADTSIFDLTPLIEMPTLLTNVLVGQRFAIPFNLTLKDNTTLIECPLSLEVFVQANNQTFTTTLVFNCTTFNNAYQFTFLDFDQTVQYAMAMSPLNQCGLTSEQCNVMVALHGFMGVTNDPSWFTNFNRQNDLWIIMPTGRSNCGYDWASSSRIDVFYGVEAMAALLPGVPVVERDLYTIDASKILFIGHSMGGMGCWNMLVREGDRAMGGACASGFPKLSMYISYETSPGFSYIDQALKAMLMISIEENNVDIISSNLVGLPLLARYGENDTVVNPYHSRRIVRMVGEQSQNASAVIVSEVPNENHWFEGMLSDPYMQAYYDEIVANYRDFLPPIPQTITVSTLNPSGTGSRANLLILQLTVPFRLAKIKLTQAYNGSQLIWYLDTQNVQKFAITPLPQRREFPDVLVIDGKKTFDNKYLYPEYHFRNKQAQFPSNQKNWEVSDDNTWVEFEKNPATYGPIRQLFESNFKIVYGTQSNETTTQLKQGGVCINNFWNNYGRGSVPVLTDLEYIEQLSVKDTSCSENLILLGTPAQNLVTEKYVASSDVYFHDDNSFSIGGDAAYYFNAPGLGIAFLMPNKCGNNLILVVAGIDSLGFDNALHTIPQRSGDITGPDFIVTGPNFKGKGYGGVVAAGYWDNNYRVSESNFYLSEITN